MRWCAGSTSAASAAWRCREPAHPIPGRSGSRIGWVRCRCNARYALRSATGWFVRVDSLGLEQLLLAWIGNDTFVPAAESLLAPLRGASGDLLRTLSVYLDQESSLVATPAALNLHRNTVAVRIRRVQELLGVDLTDPETRLAMHLACRAVLAPAAGGGPTRGEHGILGP
ncbi:CdaR family transcriptional regulator [uncultured Microbacterium sp.]|uniref:PucR family transcriptional regulator n=1 Tax=uncultured Microbacterium sp. TaxID=191216 RepID=UPI0025EB9186|nr:helix-turn-helix domain-containing protein [uncultured Microbacterium sp.]